MMVYKYGALKPKVIGGSFEDLLRYQLLSNHFYNSLIEVERWRIAAADITELLTGDRLTDDKKTEIRLAYNAACRAAGAKTPIGWGQKQAVTEMVAAAMKTRRRDETKASMKASKKGHHYLKRVMGVPRPRFRRHDGEGILQATVQGATRLDSAKVLSGLPDKYSFVVKGEGKRRTAVLRLREGLSLEVPIFYHRDLPEARVLYARLVIDRIGDRWVYSVHVTVDAKPESKVYGVGKCAINFGWRRHPDGGVRVAYAVGEDGREQELVLPDRMMSKMEHAESLRGLADEVAAVYLGDAGKRAKARKAALAAPDAKHTEFNQVHFTREMALAQRAEDAEHWARRDRHLYQWERDEYKKVLRQRAEIYRAWTRKIATEYAAIVVEAFDMRTVIQRGEYEMVVPGARHYRFLVGPHYLRLELKRVFGDACEVLKPSKTSSYCSACSKPCKWDRIRELWHDCEHCGASWDQDANNARNQLSEAAAE